MTKQDEQFREEMLDFKDQVLKFVEVSNQKFDGLTADIRTNSFKIDHLENQLENGLTQMENRLDRVEKKLDGVTLDVKQLSAQFTDVAGLVIKDHHPRINRIEEQIDALESEAH